MEVTVVTVTYGDRWHLLKQVLAACFDGGADHAVVVINGKSTSTVSVINQTFPGRTSITQLDHNGGSAVGFFEGIQKAMKEGAEFILLLDDDNSVEIDTIAKLMKAFQEKIPQTGRDRLCVVGCRLRNSLNSLMRKIPPSELQMRSIFLDFDLSYTLSRIISRTYCTKNARKLMLESHNSAFVQRATAPYGGMFFHRSLIDRYGYPNRRFALYQDDLEFTRRVTSKGGEIWFVKDAYIVDIEPSWCVTKERKTPFEVWLNLGSDMRVYYTARNKAYIETHTRKPAWMRILNKCIYLCVLWTLAVLSGKQKRFDLILRAVKDGESGVLDVCSDFPLD
jgi:GT2 family glycosyltransferase